MRVLRAKGRNLVRECMIEEFFERFEGDQGR